MQSLKEHRCFFNGCHCYNGPLPIDVLLSKCRAHKFSLQSALLLLIQIIKRIRDISLGIYSPNEKYDTSEENNTDDETMIDCIHIDPLHIYYPELDKIFIRHKFFEDYFEMKIKPFTEVAAASINLQNDYSKLHARVIELTFKSWNYKPSLLSTLPSSSPMTTTTTPSVYKQTVWEMLISALFMFIYCFRGSISWYSMSKRCVQLLESRECEQSSPDASAASAILTGEVSNTDLIAGSLMGVDTKIDALFKQLNEFKKLRTRSIVYERCPESIQVLFEYIIANENSTCEPDFNHILDVLQTSIDISRVDDYYIPEWVCHNLN